MPDEQARTTQMHLLEFELELLQKTLDKFDNARFTIKNWAVTLTGALLALSVNAKKDFRIALVGSSSSRCLPTLSCFTCTCRLRSFHAPTASRLYWTR
jgi:hypothetical protein